MSAWLGAYTQAYGVFLGLFGFFFFIYFICIRQYDLQNINVLVVRFIVILTEKKSEL
jgi:hypothetical protein